MNILTRYRINDLVEKISTLFIALGVLVISVGAIIGIIYFIVNTANDIGDQNNAVTLSYSDIEDILHQCIRNSVTDVSVERQNGSLVSLAGL